MCRIIPVYNIVPPSLPLSSPPSLSPPLPPQSSAEDVSQFDRKFTELTPIDSPVETNIISESANLIFQGFTYVAPSLVEEIEKVEAQSFRPRARYVHVLMRDEGRKKEASTVKQTTRQSNTAPPRRSLFLCMSVWLFIWVLVVLLATLALTIVSYYLILMVQNSDNCIIV